MTQPRARDSHNQSHSQGVEFLLTLNELSTWRNQQPGCRSTRLSACVLRDDFSHSEPNERQSPNNRNLSTRCSVLRFWIFVRNSSICFASSTTHVHSFLVNSISSQHLSTLRITRRSFLAPVTFSLSLSLSPSLRLPMCFDTPPVRIQCCSVLDSF